MFVDATHRRIADEVHEWMRSHRLFGDPREREQTYREQALVAATFGCLCSAADVGEAEYLRAAQFTAIFLWFDDSSEAPSGEHPAVTEWLGGLEQLGAGRSALADFRLSFADYRASLDDERRSNCSTLAREDYLALRRRTIFVEPYLDHWRVLAGIDIDGPAREVLRSGQSLARDLIILANDLGSLVRDTTAEQREMNLIVRDAQLDSLDMAVDRAIAQHNAMVSQLRELVSIAARSSEHPLPAFARLLTRVVDGNLATMRLLTGRYAQSSALLDRLSLVG
jgi:hypothetical protein